MYFSTTQKTQLKSRLGTPRTLLLLVAGTCFLNSSAHADYQQALAARAIISPEPATAPVRIERQYVQNAFLLDAEEGNRALSDKDVMVELMARMSSENQLEKAAANLDPADVASVIDKTSAR